MEIPKSEDQQYLKHTKFQLYPADGNLAEYRAGLPRHNGQTIIDCIRERTAQGQKPVNVLDIGCGKGIFLCELSLKFPQVRAFGLSAFDYRDFLEDPWFTYIKRVDYRLGDAHNLKQIFKGVRFDIVTSFYTFPYLANPSAVLDQVHSLLNSGGLAFIDNGLVVSREKWCPQS